MIDSRRVCCCCGADNIRNKQDALSVRVYVSDRVHVDVNVYVDAVFGRLMSSRKAAQVSATIVVQ